MNKIVPLSGHARPSRLLRSKIGLLYGPNSHNVTVNKVLDDLVGVDALARLLTEGIDTVTTKDGRLDTKELAAFVLRHMKTDGGHE